LGILSRLRSFDKNKILISIPIIGGKINMKYKEMKVWSAGKMEKQKRLN
jgi:hypothetical protein